MCTTSGICRETVSLSVTVERTLVLERSARPHHRVFGAADANRDGVIDKVELSSLYDRAATRSGRPSALSVDDTIAALDRDGDQAISRAEFQAGADALAAVKPSVEAEIREIRWQHTNLRPVAPWRPFEQAFRSIDTNKNGAIDRAELTELYDRVVAQTGRPVGLTVDETLGALDVDSDGAISEKELEAGLRAPDSRDRRPRVDPVRVSLRRFERIVVTRLDVRREERTDGATNPPSPSSFASPSGPVCGIHKDTKDETVHCPAPPEAPQETTPAVSSEPKPAVEQNTSERTKPSPKEAALALIQASYLARSRYGAATELVGKPAQPRVEARA